MRSADTICEGRRPRLSARGFSLIELLIVVAIILIIAALAIPNFLQARISANQASAASTVRTINTAAVSFSTAWSDGFPPTLATLGSAGGTPTCAGAELVDNSIAIAPSQKSGYTFAYLPQGAAITNPPTGCAAGFSQYMITAMPNSVLTGTQSFCMDETFVLHYNTTGAAIPSEGVCEALPTMQ
ncbi:MAG: prepilin-type N-terminal cleavage/methylation domain-containing protein [Candidatus Acidiferrales bacterium]